MTQVDYPLLHAEFGDDAIDVYHQQFKPLELTLPVTLSVPDWLLLAEAQPLALHVRLTVALDVAGIAYA
jgi:hypothetical protein